MKKTLATVAVVAVVVLVATSCGYADMARSDRANGKPVPWWCHPTEEIPVTDGPAVGSVDYYAGTHKGALTWDQCEALSAEIDSAKAYAERWPTEAAATADGWRMATGFVPGMGTHHVRGGITPAILADPSFDMTNPNLDAAGLDDVFDPAQPEVLQYEGTGPNAKLVGFDYYVRTDTGRPPDGFPGNNDWWHIHPMICYRLSDAAMVAFNTSDASCQSLGGMNVNMSNYYMLHVWVLDDMRFIPDVYAGMIPCITSSGTVHNSSDSCHYSRTGGTMSTTTVPDTAIAPGGSGQATPVAADPKHAPTCSLGTRT